MAKKTKKQDHSNLIERLEEMCIDIFAHAKNDYEITLSGNGTNASEACSVAWVILDIIHGDGRKWADANKERISKRVKELREDYGDGDTDEGQ